MQPISYHEAFEQKAFHHDFAAEVQKHGLDVTEYEERLRKIFHVHFPKKVLFFVPSATAALEMMALLLDLSEGDEVIMPSFTYTATANAFAKRGVHIRYVDIEEETLNISPQRVEPAITKKTKAVIPIHYGGHGADVKGLSDLCRHYGVHLLEDGAHAMGALYDGVQLGNFGTFGALSFHYSKNITAGGEGGLLVLSDAHYQRKAEQILHNGNNKADFNRGLVSAYQWQTLGGAYRMSALSMAYLICQMAYFEHITHQRRRAWHYYEKGFQECRQKRRFQTSKENLGYVVNGHIFYLMLQNWQQKKELQGFLAQRGIQALSHYEPLHHTQMGKTAGTFVGEDKNTTRCAQNILRLPLHVYLKEQNQQYVIEKVEEFFRG